MKKTINSLAISLALTAASAASHAAPDEDRVLAALKKRHPNTQFTGVVRTPLPGIYEAWMGPNVAFVSAKNTRYVIFGRLFDTVAMQDMTASKLANAAQQRAANDRASDRNDEGDAHAVDLDQLPLADALKTVKGKGERMLVVFSDPSCGYCKRLEPELDKLDNVTIYTFLVPFQGPAKPVAIWCASERAKAWRQYMLLDDSALLNADASCAHPIERNLTLAQKLNVRGTPTMFLSNGRRIDGYADAAELAAHLTANPPQATNAARESVKEKM